MYIAICSGFPGQSRWDAGRTCKQLEPGTDNKTVKVSLIFGFKVQPLPLENQGGIDVY